MADITNGPQHRPIVGAPPLTRPIILTGVPASCTHTHNAFMSSIMICSGEHYWNFNFLSPNRHLWHLVFQFQCLQSTYGYECLFAQRKLICLMLFLWTELTFRFCSGHCMLSDLVAGKINDLVLPIFGAIKWAIFISVSWLPSTDWIISLSTASSWAVTG